MCDLFGDEVIGSALSGLFYGSCEPYQKFQYNDDPATMRAQTPEEINARQSVFFAKYSSDLNNQKNSYRMYKNQFIDDVYSQVLSDF